MKRNSILNFFLLALQEIEKGNFSCEINNKLLKFLAGPFCQKDFSLLSDEETKTISSMSFTFAFAQDLLFKVCDQLFLFSSS